MSHHSSSGLAGYTGVCPICGAALSVKMPEPPGTVAAQRTQGIREAACVGPAAHTFALLDVEHDQLSRPVYRLGDLP